MSEKNNFQNGRRIFITWAACLGNYMFDWSNVILQYFEKDKFISVVNSNSFQSF